MNNAGLIKDIYQNVQMGLIGIDEVLFKIKDKKLLKEIKGIKKEYQKIFDNSKKYLENISEEVKDVGLMTRVSSEFMSQMKLFKEDSDKVIVDMMIKGTMKSLDIISSKKIDYDTCDIYTLKIVSNLFGVLNRSLTRLKKYVNLIE